MVQQRNYRRCVTETEGPRCNVSLPSLVGQVCEIALGILEERLRALPSRGARMCQAHAAFTESLSLFKILANKRGVHNQPHAVSVSGSSRLT